MCAVRYYAIASDQQIIKHFKWNSIVHHSKVGCFGHAGRSVRCHKKRSTIDALTNKTTLKNLMIEAS